MEENKLRPRRKRRDRFYLYYAALCGALILILMVGIIIFYDFIGEYEDSLPKRVAERYINSLDVASLSEILSRDVEDRASGFEAGDAVNDALASAVGEGIVFTECVGEDTPAYDVFCGGKLMKVRLRETDGGRYGFARYEVAEAEIYPEWVEGRFSDASVIVPASAALRINGVTVTEKYKTGKEYESAALSPLDPADRTLVEYSVRGIFGPVVITGEYGGEPLTFGRLKESPVYYSDFNVPSLRDYTIKVPSSAEVKLFGHALPDELITNTLGLTELVTEFEAAKAPTLSVYTVKGVLSQPEVTVTLAGEALTPDSSNDTRCDFSYPDTARLAYTVKVPAGMRLFCNGIEVGEGYRTASGGKYVSPYEQYGATETFDTYSIPLYLTPEFRVSNEAAVVESAGREVTFYPVPSEAEEAEIRELAETFAKLFIKYSLQGGSERVRANLDVCLSYTLSGSSAYKLLKSTFNAFRYNSNYKIKKDDTTVRDLVRYSSKCVSVKVDFDSLGTVYKYEKPASGTYYMVWVKSGGEWKLAVFNM